MIGLGLLALAAPAPLASPQARVGAPSDDWLLGERDFAARVVEADGSTGPRIVLDNGLVRRVFVTRPTLACIAFDNRMTDASMLRAVRPEAQLVVDGKAVDVGGLVGQPNHAFLRDAWLADMQASPAGLRYLGHEVGEPVERLEWKRVRHHAPDVTWPPPGVAVRFDFAADGAGPDGLRVSVHYELYDGIPLLGKRVVVRNAGAAPFEVDHLTSEILAVVETTNWVERRDDAVIPAPDHFHVETDYAFGGFVPENAQTQIVHWQPDPEFHTQVNYLKQTPCLLRVEPLRGPDVILQPGEELASWWTFELAYDSTDRERRGLAKRKMYRTLAPWVTENPLILHVVSVDEAVVKRAIDQAAECGFEMVSLSFGSGLNMEDETAANHAKFRALADYATERGIHLGGYSLLASRRILPDGDNAINAETGQPGGQRFGFAPALASDWGQSYFRKLRDFFEATGFLQFTHDGSYPGDWDAAARPPLQRGYEDSQWVQWNVITAFYRWLRARGAYLRVPDFYYLQGSNECGMGYREVNWSLPRAQQVIHTRQNIYDGTWGKTPSMGWMFVPLTQYHGGGAAATIEPLDEHLDHYERMLASNLGMGVQAVYRGHRLYDTPRVRDAVTGWVDWYKHYRDILESDLIHGRRADGRDVDWMLHAGPGLATPGMLVAYNPLEREVTKAIEVPLHLTGLRGEVRVAVGIGRTIEPARVEERTLSAERTVELALTVPAGGMVWATFRQR